MVARSIHPDLCKLALGAANSWGLNALLGLSVAPELPDQSYDPGCADTQQQILLQATDFYVCPGGHRDHHLLHKCGGSADYFCASWGCETTGTAYWIRDSVNKDLITVRRNFSYPTTAAVYGLTFLPSYYDDIATCKPNHPDTKGWCVPLEIRFTPRAHADQEEAWMRGRDWGLRLYQSGTDTGVLFSIKLLKEHVNAKYPANIGPENVIAHKPSLPRPPI